MARDIDQHQQFLNDLRALVDDCFAGVRQQDPPAAWPHRLQRIEELSRRLERLEELRVSHRGGGDSEI